MIYLASPYSHQAKSIMFDRYLAALECTALMMKSGYKVFSPIVHCHMMAQHHQMPGDFEFWMDYDYHMIKISTGIVVLAIDGWQESRGVTAELAYAAEIGKPVSFVNRYGDSISEEQARCV